MATSFTWDCHADNSTPLIPVRYTPLCQAVQSQGLALLLTVTAFQADFFFYTFSSKQVEYKSTFSNLL